MSELIIDYQQDNVLYFRYGGRCFRAVTAEYWGELYLTQTELEEDLYWLRIEMSQSGGYFAC